ncbi:hypothetical protein F5Y18DRAFT_423451 [Xylariaceae sp. FL1019]|nr:hypothetical protein F5Y18DRAFT_423451 [Xylariaceae sp. FL1019]
MSADDRTGLPLPGSETDSVEGRTVPHQEEDDFSPSDSHSSDEDEPSEPEYWTPDEFDGISLGEEPMFLFRGTHSESGGGYPGLNEPGIVRPHAFLPTTIDKALPTTIDDITYDPDVRPSSLEDEVLGHLNKHIHNTHFSSWSPTFHSAQPYCGADGAEDQRITILQGRKLIRSPSEVFPVRVYHAPALVSYAQQDSDQYPRNSNTHEYLAFGPVSGPAMHTVALKTLEQAGLYDIDLEDIDPDQDLVTTVKKAREIALLMQNPTYESPELVIATTVNLLMQPQRTRQLRALLAREDELDRAFAFILNGEMIKLWRRRMGNNGQNTLLVNPHMWAKELHLKAYVRILSRIELRLNAPAICTCREIQTKCLRDFLNPDAQN